jgi:tetratricopeptide (TPR) repeat protein
VAMMLSPSIWSQTRAINSAEFALESNTPDELVIAKEEIDKASVNEKTMNAPKMYLVKGKVYRRLFESRNNPMIAAVYMKSGLTAGQSMMEFYNSPGKKSSELNDEASIEVGSVFAAIFTEASIYSEKLTKVKPEQKPFVNDTLVMYNRIMLDLFSKLDTGILNQLKGQKVERPYFVERLAYFSLGNSQPTKRMEILEKLMNEETTSAMVVESFSKEKMALKDTIGAKEVIKKALVKSNYNNDIFNVLVNYYISINKEDALIDEINTQLKEKPTSKNYWIRGYLNERQKNYDQATLDYKESRSLDEFNYDANWNLAVALMKYENKKLIDLKSKATGEEKAKIEKQLTSNYEEAKKYLEYASENSAYSKEELINISKATRTCCLELGNKNCAIEQRDKIRLLNGHTLQIGDKFTYRVTGDATNMEISYQNKQNTNSTVSNINGNFEKEFDYIDKSDMLTLSIRILGDGFAHAEILVNGVMVAEKEADGKGQTIYLSF